MCVAGTTVHYRYGPALVVLVELLHAGFAYEVGDRTSSHLGNCGFDEDPLEKEAKLSQLRVWQIGQRSDVTQLQVRQHGIDEPPGRVPVKAVSVFGTPDVTNRHTPQHARRPR